MKELTVGQLSREPRMLCMKMGPLVGSDREIQLMPQAENHVSAGLPRVYRQTTYAQHASYRTSFRITIDSF